MRGARAKLLRKEAVKLVSGKPEGKATVKRVVKRFLTGKADAEGKPVIESINRDTRYHTGYMRVYHDLKKAWREKHV